MNGRLDGVILELITRTKALVSDLDNFQYRKMRKLVYLDEQQSIVTDDVMTTDRHDVVSLLFFSTSYQIYFNFHFSSYASRYFFFCYLVNIVKVVMLDFLSGRKTVPAII